MHTWYLQTCSDTFENRMNRKSRRLLELCHNSSCHSTALGWYLSPDTCHGLQRVSDSPVQYDDSLEPRLHNIVCCLWRRVVILRQLSVICGSLPPFNLAILPFQAEEYDDSKSN